MIKDIPLQTPLSNAFQGKQVEHSFLVCSLEQTVRRGQLKALPDGSGSGSSGRYRSKYFIGGERAHSAGRAEVKPIPRARGFCHSG